jgi:hypothetical protein
MSAEGLAWVAVIAMLFTRNGPGRLIHFGKTWVAVLRNKSRAAHWSPLVHCTMKMATIPVLGSTD